MSPNDSLRDLALRSASAELAVLKASITTSRAFRDQINPVYQQYFPESWRRFIPALFRRPKARLTRAQRVEMQALHDAAWRLSERARTAFEHIGSLEIPLDFKKRAEVLYRLTYYECTTIICFAKFSIGDEGDSESARYLAAMQEAAAHIHDYTRIAEGIPELPLPSPVPSISNDTLGAFGASAGQLTIQHWRRTMARIAEFDRDVIPRQRDVLALYMSVSFNVISAVIPSHFVLAVPEVWKSYMASLRAGLPDESLDWKQVSERIQRYDDAAKANRLLTVEYLRAIIDTLQELGPLPRPVLEIVVDEVQELGRAVAELRNV